MHDELTAARAAAEAGARTIRSRSNEMGEVRSKSWATDLVTETDIAAGVAVAHALMDHDTGARFVIEEEEVYERAGATRGALADPEVWVVDPLDGTTSFVHGFPCYSVSVALLRNGNPVAGAVANVPLGETISAACGLGATRDGRPVRCSQAKTLDTALLITGFPYDRGAPLDRQLAVLAAFLRAPVHGIRRDGSAAIDCTHVASGRADGFWEYGLQPWDVAAGVVICREAGARITALDGSEWSPETSGILAASPQLHPLMLEIIRTTESTVGERG